MPDLSLMLVIPPATPVLSLYLYWVRPPLTDQFVPAGTMDWNTSPGAYRQTKYCVELVGTPSAPKVVAAPFSHLNWNRSFVSSVVLFLICSMDCPAARQPPLG